MVTFAGALVMTLYKGPVVGLFSSSTESLVHHHATDTSASGGGGDGKHFIAGTLIILLACVGWSSFVVLQTVTLKKYPANLTLTALICSFGALQTAAIGFASERRASMWGIGWNTRLLGCAYLVN